MAISTHIYLTYNGNCEEAFNFYKGIFGGEFTYIGRFKEMPADPNNPLRAEDGDRIMHVSLPIGNSALMASDTSSQYGNVTVGNNFSVSLNVDNQKEADRLHAALSAGGIITMPMADTFWGSYFGMCTDRFGINWMISFAKQQH